MPDPPFTVVQLHRAMLHSDVEDTCKAKTVTAHNTVSKL